MEIVTLGAIGDSFCGKSQLLLSYTANCVRNAYVPTVLDCLWTTAIVDGVFIDLRIWDSTGSVSYVRMQYSTFGITFNKGCKALVTRKSVVYCVEMINQISQFLLSSHI